MNQPVGQDWNINISRDQAGIWQVTCHQAGSDQVITGMFENISSALFSVRLIMIAQEMHAKKSEVKA